MLWREIHRVGEGMVRYTERQEEPRKEGRAIHSSLWLASLKKEGVREKSILGTSDAECKGLAGVRSVCYFLQTGPRPVSLFILVSSVVDFEELERSR